jgi:hypothetical protein
MKIKASKKEISMDDLAVMVAKGFEATKTDIEKLDKKIDSVKAELKKDILGLKNSVNNYLKLSDRRYLEQENKLKILAKYLKIVIQRSKIPVDLKQLETVLK